jgi:cell division cycle protein 37
VNDVPAAFANKAEQLKTNPSPEAPPGPGAVTYDEMILALLLRVYQDVKDKGVVKEDPGFGNELIAALKVHLGQLKEAIDTKKAELNKELQEKAKKITTEDIHEGFESKYIPAKPAPEPVIKPKQPKKKTTTTEIEVLNPKASASTSSATPSSTSAIKDEDLDDMELPEMTPSLLGFSKIPYGDFEQSFRYIQAHRDTVVEGASDALIVAAFTAESEGKHKYARQCVHQSLLLQYCEKIGGDGVRMFFGKMISGDKRAIEVFNTDVEQTWAHVKNRVAVTKAEAAAVEGQEQIQLVAENPETTISFNVPDGPPPEDLRLEGEGMEGVDVEQVRQVLQLRWDLYQSFPENLQEALKTNDLEKVNKVLGAMPVSEAEDIVNKLDMGGILNFAEGGIRDETGGQSTTQDVGSASATTSNEVD